LCFLLLLHVLYFIHSSYTCLLLPWDFFCFPIHDSQISTVDEQTHLNQFLSCFFFSPIFINELRK
jgi:hypothetical protein